MNGIINDVAEHISKVIGTNRKLKFACRSRELTVVSNGRPYCLGLKTGSRDQTGRNKRACRHTNCADLRDMFSRNRKLNGARLKNGYIVECPVCVRMAAGCNGPKTLSSFKLPARAGT